MRPATGAVIRGARESTIASAPRARGLAAGRRHLQRDANAATAVDALDTVDDDEPRPTGAAARLGNAGRGSAAAWADAGAYGQGAYGEMVACDGGCDNWFHFECVGLARAPRGEYICDACGAGFGFRRAYDDEDDDDDRALACLQENPKKPGTACNLRYEAYKSATTVAEFLEKGGTPADLTHDVGKGFVWYLDADDGRGGNRRRCALKNVRVLQCGRFAPTRADYWPSVSTH